MIFKIALSTWPVGQAIFSSQSILYHALSVYDTYLSTLDAEWDNLVMRFCIVSSTIHYSIGLPEFSVFLRGLVQVYASVQKLLRFSGVNCISDCYGQTVLIALSTLIKDADPFEDSFCFKRSCGLSRTYMIHYLGFFTKASSYTSQSRCDLRCHILALQERCISYSLHALLARSARQAQIEQYVPLRPAPQHHLSISCILNP